ncbi:non-hydrolyzing UDP-N-acetylglucosamine 2-epimerase [Arthrobacter woluwensis]|jgi:UDP-N-acetylglucosamine 2-epimerase (non-hydrolysing)|uniref:non-hydrolyzing UDP-N-acetylglucosamine 2-epimerase n=1 Tax=Arthrobacter woluwensis TaxID=156980 RepID=UPI0037F3BD16
MPVLNAPERALGDIAVVLGTRPEIIKLAGIIRHLGSRARTVHTGQHWDDAMAGRFFRDLGLGQPDVRLHSVAGRSRALQIGNGISELAEHFQDRPVTAVIVQGDTNSTTIGAQAANYAGVPVMHVEAGLRSHDRAMPEEINRLVVGAIADLHCAATSLNAENLLREGVESSRVLVTGNTVVEATLLARQLPHRDIQDQVRAQVVREGYSLVTIHRPENTDTPEALERVLSALSSADSNIVFTLHPRTAAAIERFGLQRYLEGIEVLTGVGHADFLELASHARLIVSDSGGVQEEVTVLKKPLLVVRRSTERPESIDAGFSRLITPELDLAAEMSAALADSKWSEGLRNRPSPYGDGSASRRIAQRAQSLRGRATVLPAL